MAEWKRGEIKTLQNIQYSRCNQTCGPRSCKGAIVMRITDFPGPSMFWGCNYVGCGKLTRQPGNSVVVWGLAVHRWLVNVQKANFLLRL